MIQGILKTALTKMRIKECLWVSNTNNWKNNVLFLLNNSKYLIKLDLNLSKDIQKITLIMNYLSNNISSINTLKKIKVK